MIEGGGNKCTYECVPTHCSPVVGLASLYTLVRDYVPRLYLCKQRRDGTILYLLVIPQVLRRAAMVFAHVKESAHLGQHKTILKTKEQFYWPNLKRDVSKYVRECITCQQFKTARGLQQRWQEPPPVDHPPRENQYRHH